MIACKNRAASQRDKEEWRISWRAMHVRLSVNVWLDAHCRLHSSIKTQKKSDVSANLMI